METSKLAALFENIKQKVYPHYGVAYGNYSSGGDRDSAKIHSYILLVLEIYIAEYKEKLNLNKMPFVKLSGDSALRHSILIKYRYPLEKVNSLPLQDMVFLLLEDLSPDNFCAKARDYLSLIELKPEHSNNDWNLKVNWNLGDGADYLSEPDTE